jgi:hypothetical protein
MMQIVELAGLEGVRVEGEEIVEVVLDVKLLEAGQFLTQGGQLYPDGCRGLKPAVDVRRRAGIPPGFQGRGHINHAAGRAGIFLHRTAGRERKNGGEAGSGGGTQGHGADRRS